MRVKTFTGTHRFAVDKQVNNWLAKTRVTVFKTNVAFKSPRQRVGYRSRKGNDPSSTRDCYKRLV
jgi:hypothetical protein